MFYKATANLFDVVKVCKARYLLFVSRIILEEE